MDVVDGSTMTSSGGRLGKVLVRRVQLLVHADRDGARLEREIKDQIDAIVIFEKSIVSLA